MKKNWEKKEKKEQQFNKQQTNHLKPADKQQLHNKLQPQPEHNQYEQSDIFQSQIRNSCLGDQGAQNPKAQYQVERSKIIEKAIRISTALHCNENELQEKMQESVMDCSGDFLTLKIELKDMQEGKKNTRSGVLEKQSPGFFSKWERRFCRLQGVAFSYHNDADEDSAIVGYLNFDIVGCRISVEVSNFTIHLNNSQKYFTFRGQNKQQTMKWANEIKYVIDNSLGYKHNYDFVNYPRFWRKLCIMDSQLKRQAQTGDILLFRSRRPSAIVQRTFTGDQYDHVAMILLNIRNQILFFQANGGVGVGLCPHSKFIKKKWYSQQELIVYRKLNVKRTEEFLKTVENFVENSLGKKYKLSIRKLLMQRSSDQLTEKKSYFCSSLVAKLYKILGLLDPVISSTQYHPSSFASDGVILKCDGKYGPAFLGPESIIVFGQRLSN